MLRTMMLAILMIAACGRIGLAEEVRTSHVVGEGRPWETIYHTIDSGEPGPTVMIVGGVHGNEPAGSAAAEQIACWSIRRGRLVVLPRANTLGLEQRKRRLPFASKRLRDLNRNFPKQKASPEARGQVAPALWEIVLEHRPQWLLDLHEGYDFNRINPKSVGSTIISAPSDEAQRLAGLMLEEVNEIINEPLKKFGLKAPPVKGSLARAAAEQLGAGAMILETTRKQQPRSLRARQHRLMVHRFLTCLEMVDSDVQTLTPSEQSEEKSLRVALYDAADAVEAELDKLERELESNRAIVRRVGAYEVSRGALEQFDALMLPRGEAQTQLTSLGKAGRRRLERFLDQGGGLLGLSPELLDAAASALADFELPAESETSPASEDGEVAAEADRQVFMCGYGKGRVVAPDGSAASASELVEALAQPAARMAERSAAAARK